MNGHGDSCFRPSTSNLKDATYAYKEVPNFLPPCSPSSRSPSRRHNTGCPDKNAWSGITQEATKNELLPIKFARSLEFYGLTALKIWFEPTSNAAPIQPKKFKEKLSWRNCVTQPEGLNKYSLSHQGTRITIRVKVPFSSQKRAAMMTATVSVPPFARSPKFLAFQQHQPPFQYTTIVKASNGFTWVHTRTISYLFHSQISNTNGFQFVSVSNILVTFELEKKKSSYQCHILLTVNLRS